MAGLLLPNLWQCIENWWLSSEFRGSFGGASPVLWPAISCPKSQPKGRWWRITMFCCRVATCCYTSDFWVVKRAVSAEALDGSPVLEWFSTMFSRELLVRCRVSQVVFWLKKEWCSLTHPSVVQMLFAMVPVVIWPCASQTGPAGKSQMYP